MASAFEKKSAELEKLKNQPFRCIGAFEDLVQHQLAECAKTKSQAIPLNYAREFNLLTKLVQQFVDYIEFCLLEFQSGRTGLPADPVGFFTGQSVYSSPQYAKYPDAMLIDEIAKEYIAQKKSVPIAPDIPVSSTAIAQTIASQEPVAQMDLTDNSKILINKESGDIGYQVEGEESPRWYQSTWNKVKSFGSWLLGHLSGMWSKIKEYTSKGWNWVCGLFGSDGEEDIVVQPPHHNPQTPPNSSVPPTPLPS